MGNMKISSESIPASSEVFWNRFRIIGPKPVCGIGSEICSDIGSEIGSGNGSEIGIGSGIGYGIKIDSGIGIGTEIKTSFQTESVLASP